MDPTWQELYFVRHQLKCLQSQQQAVLCQRNAVKKQLKSLARQKMLLDRNIDIVGSQLRQLRSNQVDMATNEDMTRDAEHNPRFRCMGCGHDFGSWVELNVHMTATSCGP